MVRFVIHYFSGNDYSTDFAMHARLFSYWYCKKKPVGRPVLKEDVDVKTYMAGYLSFMSAEDPEDVAVTRSAKPTGILETFYYITKKAQALANENIQTSEWLTFLDSGGFSAFTQGKAVNIDEYIDYCKQTMGAWDIIAALDVIGDAEASWKNFEYMRKKGIDAMPCFHHGEPYSFLDRMAKECDYIAIGGVAQLGGGPALSEFLDNVWDRLIDGEGKPKLKVHGFAITGQAMRQYPWESCDSSSWLQMAGRGVVALDLPSMNRDFVDLKIGFSERSPSQEELGKHYDTLDPMTQGQIRTYVESLGYQIEDLRRYYRWRQHFNIGYYKRMESRCITRWTRQQPTLSLY